MLFRSHVPVKQVLSIVYERKPWEMRGEIHVLSSSAITRGSMALLFRPRYVQVIQHSASRRRRRETVALGRRAVNVLVYKYMKNLA